MLDLMTMGLRSAPSVAETAEPALSKAARRAGALLEQCPLAAVEDLAALLGVSRSLAGVGLLELEAAGLAERAGLGCQRRLTGRWWLTAAGVERFHKGGWGSWNEEWALSRLLERLPAVEGFYPAAAGLAGLGRLCQFKWAQRRAMDAAADYEGGWAALLWCGKAEGPRQLDARLQRIGEEMPGLAAGGGDCWPSAFVAVAADCWQGVTVAEVFREFGWQDSLFVWCCVHQDYEAVGRARPRRGWIYQALQRPGPENWSWSARVADSCWGRQGGSGAGWLLSFVFEWPGLGFDLAAAYFGGAGKRRSVREYARILAEAGLVEVHREQLPMRMNLNSRGLNQLVMLDRVRRAEVLRKTQGQSWASTARLKKHEEGLMALVSGLVTAGCPAAAGWRYWEYLAGAGGIAPDALVFLEASPYGPGWHFVEYERSARSEARVRRKLWGYGMVTRKNRWPVLVACWDEAAERVFWRVGAEKNVPMLTTTLERLKEFGPAGNGECWRRYGEPAVVG